MGKLVAKIKSILNEESGNLLFWLLFCFVLGDIYYFSLHNEPSIFFIGKIIVILLIALIFARKFLITSLLIISFSLGIIIPYFKTSSINTEFVSEEPTFYKVKGAVESILPGNKGMIVVLKNVSLSNKETKGEEKKYNKIRLSVKTKLESTKIGDLVSLKAMLYRPSNSVILGGYDFARKAYFDSISAVGYSLSDIEIISPAKSSSVEQIRYNITGQLVEELGRSLGGIASGLIVGEYSFIDKQLLEEIRISGLTHLLSVSGMHISIIAMIFFLAARKLCLIFVNQPIYFHSKKISALIAIIGSFMYLAISGYKIAAIRAFIMSSIYFLGIIFERFTVSKRSVILSAFVILLIWPDNLIHPSFLMSFLAVIAIIVTYDFIYERNYLAHYNFISKYIIFMIITSLVATVSTLPVIAINFNNISIYSVISNLFAVPLTSVYLMPCVILYFIAYLISCELLIIKLIKPGLIIFEKIAQYVSHLPHANIKISYINHSLVYSLILVFTSSLFLRSRDLRRIFLVIGSVLAIYVPFSVETAHIIINKKLQIALFENNHRQMEFSSRKVPSWYKSAYMAYMGAEETDYNPDIRTSEFCCDNGYCAYSRGNKRLIFKVKDLFYSRRSPNSCDNFRDIYDYNHIVDLAEIKEGIYAIFTDNKIKIVQFEELNYNRPWNK